MSVVFTCIHIDQWYSLFTHLFTSARPSKEIYPVLLTEIVDAQEFAAAYVGGVACTKEKNSGHVIL